MDKARWTSVIRAAGMSDENMWKWPREFEAREPEGHQEFLESLSIDTVEVARSRVWSRA